MGSVRKNATELRDGTERVEVEWIDSSSDFGWQDEDEIIAHHERADHLLCATTGYLVHETPEHIIVAQSLSATGPRSRGVGNLITIPQSQIMNRWTLRR